MSGAGSAAGQQAGAQVVLPANQEKIQAWLNVKFFKAVSGGAGEGEDQQDQENAFDDENQRRFLDLIWEKLKGSTKIPADAVEAIKQRTTALV